MFAAFFGIGCCAGRTALYWVSISVPVGVLLKEGSSGDESSSERFGSFVGADVSSLVAIVSLAFSNCCNWVTVM